MRLGAVRSELPALPAQIGVLQIWEAPDEVSHLGVWSRQFPQRVRHLKVLLAGQSAQVLR